MAKELLTEIYRMRSLMELHNTEPKVRFRQGIDYHDITTLPESPRVDTFMGDETGTLVEDPNLNNGEIKAILDDGRIILTTDDAVDEIENDLDVHSKEEYVNNDGGGSGIAMFEQYGFDRELIRQKKLMHIPVVIKESAELLTESKKTEQEALRLLIDAQVPQNRAAAPQNPEAQTADEGIDPAVKARSLQTIEELKTADKTKNQIMLPTMVKAILDRTNNLADVVRGDRSYESLVSRFLPDIKSLFASISEMVNSNKIQAPQITDAGYVIGDRTYPDYLRFSEYIHGLEKISKGHAKWKGSIKLDTSEKPIWEGNGISIYDGNDVGKCIHYTTGGLTGKHYGFCIGQPANTMWQSYRDTKTSTFHYIIDSNRKLDDPLHIVVLDYTHYGIELTDATNNTGTIAHYGTNKNGYLNYLREKGVPVDALFRNKPKTPEEERESEKLGYSNRRLDWFQNLSYEEQSKYIGRGHLLSDEQFAYLWQFHNDKGGYHLLHQYLDTGQAIPENQFKLLTS